MGGSGSRDVGVREARNGNICTTMFQLLAIEKIHCRKYFEIKFCSLIQPQKFFNSENFPIYGILHYGLLTLNSITLIKDTSEDISTLMVGPKVLAHGEMKTSKHTLMEQQAIQKLHAATVQRLLEAGGHLRIAIQCKN